MKTNGALKKSVKLTLKQDTTEEEFISIVGYYYDRGILFTSLQNEEETYVMLEGTEEQLASAGIFMDIALSKEEWDATKILGR